MANMIYNVLCYDAADDQTCAIVAFESEQIAEDWRMQYVKDNYDTDKDMNEQGIWVWVEPTIFQKGRMVQ